MNDVRKFTVLATSTRPLHELIEDMDEAIRAVVYSYAGQVPVAVAVGVLYCAAKEILDEQK